MKQIIKKEVEFLKNLMKHYKNVEMSLYKKGRDKETNFVVEWDDNKKKGKKRKRAQIYISIRASK